MRSSVRWKPSISLILTLLLCAVGWSLIFASCAHGQEGSRDIEVQKHYRLFVTDSESVPGTTLRTEYHLMVGVERSASLVFGGVEGEPAPRMVAVAVGDNEYEGDMLCFVIDEVEGMAPESIIGERPCFIYDREADTMAPVNDPDGMIMGDCGDDHTYRGPPPLRLIPEPRKT